MADQMTLGELIAMLENVPAEYASADGTRSRKTVRFNFEYLRPVGLDSWRGRYNELAINFGTEGAMYLDDFLNLLREAVGREYQGYKGGQFTMRASTPLWVANWGHAGDTGVVGVRVDDWEIILLTDQCA